MDRQIALRHIRQITQMSPRKQAAGANFVKFYARRHLEYEAARMPTAEFAAYRTNFEGSVGIVLADTRLSDLDLDVADIVAIDTVSVET